MDPTNTVNVIARGVMNHKDTLVPQFTIDANQDYGGEK